MNVLIVARTKMSKDRRCIGGIVDDGRSVRLLTASGEHWPTDAPFMIGQIWEVNFQTPVNLVAPHVEDVILTRQQYVGVQPNLRGHLIKRVSPWQGGIDQLFNGFLSYTQSKNGFICERLGVPTQSTGFWIPDHDLVLRSDGKHYDYRFGYMDRGLSYVGEPAALPVLPAGALVRVSLARWWKPKDAAPDFEKRCYLQLSGWY